MTWDKQITESTSFRDGSIVTVFIDNTVTGEMETVIIEFETVEIAGIAKSEIDAAKPKFTEMVVEVAVKHSWVSMKREIVI